MDKVEISDRLEDVDFDFVHNFLSQFSHWKKDIGPNTLRRALEHSNCISAFINGAQVGFVRVVSDHATFAWVDDLFVDEKYRGNGIKKN
jgi:hypothetical protein